MPDLASLIDPLVCDIVLVIIGIRKSIISIGSVPSGRINDLGEQVQVIACIIIIGGSPVQEIIHPYQSTITIIAVLDFCPIIGDFLEVFPGISKRDEAPYGVCYGAQGPPTIIVGDGIPIQVFCGYNPTRCRKLVDQAIDHG
jgi:hypothetical protein